MPQTIITIETTGPGVIEFTADAEMFIAAQGTRAGLLTVFVRHTSCSLLTASSRSYVAWARFGSSRLFVV